MAPKTTTTKSSFGGKGMLPILLIAMLSVYSMVRVSIPVTHEVSSVLLIGDSNNRQKAGKIRPVQSAPAEAAPTDSGSGSGSKTTTTPPAIHKATPHKNDAPPIPKKRTKFYAIHIGPSKTGTSAIQTNLAQNPFRENTLDSSKDRVVYVGKRYGDGWDDPNLRNTIRTIGGRTIAPKDEFHAHQDAIHCMDDALESWYRSPNGETNETIVVHNSGNDRPNRTALDHLLDTDPSARASLRIFLEACWIQGDKDFSYLLDYSIIDSNEAYSYRSKSEKRGVLGRRFRLFGILGYDRLLVVGAYRRYADWLVSAYTQQSKQRCIRGKNHRGSDRDPLGFLWREPCPGVGGFLESHLKTEDSYDGRIDQYRNLHATLPEIRAAGPPHLETRILNFFQLPRPGSPNATVHGDRFPAYHSITTELYCDALGMELTPHTCRYAQQIEELKTAAAAANAGSPPKRRRRRLTRKWIKTAKTTSQRNSTNLAANKGSFSDVAYQHIVAAGYRYGHLKLDIPERVRKEHARSGRRECRDKNWSDRLKLCLRGKQTPAELEADLDAATDHGRLPVVPLATNLTWRELSHHHRAVASWTDLPLRCLAPDPTRKLLKKSLALEELLMPTFFASPLGRDELERVFWRVWLDQKKLFCWVDVATLFTNATSWHEVVTERMGLPETIDWTEALDDGSSASEPRDKSATVKRKRNKQSKTKGPSDAR